MTRWGLFVGIITFFEFMLTQAVQVIGFGSCNKQWLPQNHWKTIREVTNPQYWLWLGDNVYAKNKSLVGLYDAYDNITHNEYYSDFRRFSQIEGVWDDHDYGVNDGGKDIENYGVRRKLFLDFINLPGVDSEISDKISMKRGSEIQQVCDSSKNQCPAVYVSKIGASNSETRGLYYSSDIHLKYPEDHDNHEVKVAKIIFLDTRSFRDNHYIKSLAEYPSIPLSPIFAALIRAGSALLGLGRNHSGDILGIQQWEWLAQELSSSTADFHVIVSSIQVLTSNPIYESWGHFPIARKRLMEMVMKYDPSGLVFLSGDVHLAEISTANITRENGETSHLMEVTSSGLTHSCMTGLTRFVCPAISNAFGQHREHLHDVYLGKNYGSMQLLSAGDNSSDNAKPSSLNISIISLETNRVVLQTVIDSRPSSASGDSKSTTANSIVSINVPDFPHLSETASSDMLANMILIVVVSVFLVVYLLHKCLLSCTKSRK